MDRLVLEGFASDLRDRSSGRSNRHRPQRPYGDWHWVASPVARRCWTEHQTPRTHARVRKVIQSPIGDQIIQSEHIRVEQRDAKASGATSCGRSRQRCVRCSQTVKVRSEEPLAWFELASSDAS